MKKIIRANKNVNKKPVTAAESYGWVVDENEAWDAYEFVCDYMGKEYVDDAIVNTLSVDDVASSLAYLFRMWDFREWEERNEEDIEESTRIGNKRSVKASSKKNVTGKKPVKASSEKLFYGVPGVKFIWHGEWSDPEVEYEGEVYNYYDLEDALYAEYNEICAEEGTSCTDKGFENWVHENPDVVYGWLYDLEPVAEAKPEITKNDIGSVLTRWGLKK